MHGRGTPDVRAFSQRQNDPPVCCMTIADRSRNVIAALDLRGRCTSRVSRRPWKPFVGEHCLCRGEGRVAVIKGGPEELTFSVPECPVLRVRTPESDPAVLSRLKNASTRQLCLGLRNRYWVFSGYVILKLYNIIS